MKKVQESYMHGGQNGREVQAEAKAYTDDGE